MDMEPDIANWVLEYLLKKPIEDRTIKSLIRVLPLPNNNPNFIKLLLLKKIESEISRNSINESLLEYLEQLEEIEFQQGNESVSDAMKHAYCMVAVECTVKPLVAGNDGDNIREHKYFDAVKRLWKGRIGRMMKVVEKGGLGSEELSVWKDQIEDAVWHDNGYEIVVNKWKELSAVDAVRGYLIEERERMGPSFLELVSAKVKDDKVVKQILGVGTTDVEDEAPSHVEEEPSRVEEEPSRVEAAPSHVEEAPSRVEEAPSRVEEAPFRVEEAPSRVEEEPSRVEEEPSRVEEAPSHVEEEPSRVEAAPLHVEEPSHVEEEPSRVEAAPLQVEEPSRVEEAPSQSVDRVPDVGNVDNKTPTKGRIQLRQKLLNLRHFKRHTSGKSRKANRRAKVVDSDEIAVEPSHGNHYSQFSEEVNRVREALESSAVDLQAVVQDPLPDALQFAETISGTVKENNVKENNVSDVHKRSLMKRKRSVHTSECSGSIDEPEENEASQGKPLLPTPRARGIPLKRYKMKNVKKRRERKCWSVLEEDTLRAGVKKFGKGNWIAILMAYRDKFEDRTDGDLKDKWRNMTRSGETINMVNEGTGL